MSQVTFDEPTRSTYLGKVIFSTFLNGIWYGSIHCFEHEIEQEKEKTRKLLLEHTKNIKVGYPYKTLPMV